MEVVVGQTKKRWDMSLDVVRVELRELMTN